MGDKKRGVGRPRKAEKVRSPMVRLPREEYDGIKARADQSERHISVELARAVRLYLATTAADRE